MNNKVMFSSNSDHWATPTDVFNDLNKEFKFNFDPCPLYSDYGLIGHWKERCFVNPPFSVVSDFLEYGMIEMDHGCCELLVYLVASRTDTKWFHDIVLRRANEIRFLRGRLKFGNSKNSAPFPSCVIIFNREAKDDE